MNRSSSITVGTALELVAAWMPFEMSARDAVTIALQEMSSDDALSISTTDVQKLIRIYRRRLRHSSDVVGTSDLLGALESLEASEVVGATVSIGRAQIVLWFDTQLSKVIGCLVGSDRRIGG